MQFYGLSNRCSAENEHWFAHLVIYAQIIHLKNILFLIRVKLSHGKPLTDLPVIDNNRMCQLLNDLYMSVCVLVGQVSTVKWLFNTVNNNKTAYTHTHAHKLSLYLCLIQDIAWRKGSAVIMDEKICIASVLQGSSKSLQIKEPQQPRAFKEPLLKSLLHNCVHDPQAQ